MKGKSSSGLFNSDLDGLKELMTIRSVSLNQRAPSVNVNVWVKFPFAVIRLLMQIWNRSFVMVAYDNGFAPMGDVVANDRVQWKVFAVFAFEYLLCIFISFNLYIVLSNTEPNEWMHDDSSPTSHCLSDTTKSKPV